MPSSFDIIRCCRLGFDMAGCNRRVRLRNPLREICTVGSVRGEISVGHGEPNHARSRKRWKEAQGRVQPTRSPLSGKADFCPALTSGLPVISELSSGCFQVKSTPQFLRSGHHDPDAQKIQALAVEKPRQRSASLLRCDRKL